MEQLSRETLRLLMERNAAIEARTGTLAADPGGAPWARRQTAPQPHVPAAADPSGSPAFNSACGQPAVRHDYGGECLPMPIGIERRLVRRAEARWTSLRQGDALPEAAAAGALLAPPFASRAMLISFPGLATDADDSGTVDPGTKALFSHVGEALATLCELPDGLVMAAASPVAPLASRLAALAESSLRSGAACLMDSDEDGAANPANGTRPELLLRAIALPLAPARNGMASSVVVVSWRKLLSREETAALHRELTAAITSMHHHVTRT